MRNVPASSFGAVEASVCPRSGVLRRPHDFRYGDRHDLNSYGSPDLGVTVCLGRCDRCGTPMLAVGPAGADTTAQMPVWLVLSGADLGEE
jgi:hypothetical protein